MSPAPGTIRKTRLSPCHQPTKVRAEAALRRRRPERSRGTTAYHQMPIRNREIGFCAFTLRPGQIGFVLHVSPSAVGTPGPIGFVLHDQHGGSEAARRRAGVPPQVCPQSTIEKLGSFCTFHSRPSHAPREDNHYPYTPVHPSLASFCAVSSFSSCGGAKLGSFRTFTLRPGQIGFVLRILPPAPARSRPLSIRNPQSAVAKLGSFCTFRPVLSTTFQPQMNADKR
jgi:hypothetical protein